MPSSEPDRVDARSIEPDEERDAVDRSLAALGDALEDDLIGSAADIATA